VYIQKSTNNHGAWSRRSAPSVLLLAFVLLSLNAFGQFKGNRGAIQSSYGLKETRDSVLKFSIDAPTLKVLGDSLGYGAAKDTILASVNIMFPGGYTDSSGAFFFRYLTDGSASAYRRLAVLHAPTEIQVAALYITHEFDSSGVFYAQRDTSMGARGPVTIPRGSYVLVAYSGAGSYSGGQAQSAQFQRQEIGVFYILGGNSAGALVRACEGEQVPLILGAGWAKGLGVRGSALTSNQHTLSVTLKFKKL
jgi:hypothetical protein